jgi:hypothetical protein
MPLPASRGAKGQSDQYGGGLGWLKSVWLV